jgi:lactate dehydrogenase-like 2-hydroxyacid dehydrogenase
MAKPHVLQIGSYPDWDQAPLDEAFQMHRYFEAKDKLALLASVGPHVRAIATRGDLGASRELIAACPKLEMISVYGIGTDGVDLAAARERGIRVSNTPDVLTDDVADLGVAMMLCQARGLVGAESWVRDDSWAVKGMYPLKHKVCGRKAGVLGLGRIGHAVARRLAAFDIDVAYSSRTPKQAARHWTISPTL